jgi:hypothetical protein
MNIQPFYDALPILRKADFNGKFKLMFEYDNLLRLDVPILEYVDRLKTKRFRMRFPKFENIKAKDVAEAFLTTLREKTRLTIN